MKIFFYLHLTGLVFLSIGLWLLFFDATASLAVDGMMWIASALGMGLMLVSPWPVVKVLQWMQREDG